MPLRLFMAERMNWLLYIGGGVLSLIFLAALSFNNVWDDTTESGALQRFFMFMVGWLPIWICWRFI